MTIKAKKSKINLREKLAELLNFRQIRDRLDGLGLYLGKDRTGSAENVAVRGGANVDDLQLAEVSAVLGDTAVDVFVYDTSKDSDGGKWRERTQHTSWYNEELNTATRGSRREFPAVAVIVAEINKVTIYDGDDPDLSMWMVFPSTSSLLTSGSTTSSLSLYALNGDLVFGNSSTYYGAMRINFITERIIGYHDSASFFGLYKYNISQRSLSNSTSDFVGDSSTFAIVNRRVNDVAMTILPNAPIDDNTGLPIPTIAVATNGGVSVIKDDGSVVDSASSSTWHRVDFCNSVLYATLDGNPSPVYIVDDYLSDGFTQSARIYPNSPFHASDSGVALLANAVTDESEIKVLNDITIGNVAGLTLVDDKEVKTTLYSYTTSSYNTGWMPGDIKLATLSDNTVGTVGVDEGEEVFVDSNGNWIGDFDQSSDLNGWALFPAGASSTIENGRVKIENGTPETNPYFRSPAISVEPGKTYKFSFYYLGDGANQVNVHIHSGSGYGSDQAYGQFYGEGVHSMILTPDVSTIWIKLIGYDLNLDGLDHTYDNISLKEYSGELVVNGQFTDGTTGWILSSSNAPTVSSGALQFNNVDGSAQSHAEQEIPTIAGEKYLLSFDYVGSSTLNIYIGTSQGGSQILNTSISSSNGYSFSFVATSSSTWIRFRDNVSGATPTIDDVSVRLAEDDRSVNNNGLQVFGEIDKTPVAPGADLVAYSGFSADNYLMQPYNSDLNFGTEDFCVMGWVKVSDMASLTYSLVYRSAQVITGNYYHCSLSQGKLKFARNDGSAEDNITGLSDLDDNTWHHFCGVYEGGDLKIYVDGRADADKVTAVNTGSIDDSSAVLTLGTRPNLTQFLDGGSLALCRVSATAPTDAQIAKIYRDEKVLFQDGAQGTLYGTSDAVTALAYDDKTELLHVGTSSGRSDFSGLSRINNTTTAVTTSISASNNLIAEQ